MFKVHAVAPHRLPQLFFVGAGEFDAVGLFHLGRDPFGQGKLHGVGVADVELEDAEEVPPVFVAVEVKVYAVPLVKPDTTQDPDAPVTVQVFPARTPEESDA